MNRYQNILSIFLLTGFFFSSCRPTTTVPKPLGYFKIELPAKHQYHNFDSSGFPFSFRFPVYATITQDSSLAKEEHAPYWIDVSFPDLNAKIYLSYKKISQSEPLEKLIDESYKLSFSHDVKADYIHTPAFKTQNGLQGVYYQVGGNAASNYQFFITDGQRNFVRGSLYFDVTPNVDSLKPAINFLKQDLDTLIQSFRFISK
jgi:gliding motility-associated lipoprotein GldD